MSSGGPARQSDSLADVVEMLLDKGVVINADIVVSIGDTELLGVQLRAAIASFETAAEYGLEFPEGTDMRRVEQASGRSELPDEDEDTVQTAIVEAGEAISESAEGTTRRSEPGLRARPAGTDSGDDGDDEDDADDGDGTDEGETEDEPTPEGGDDDD